MSFALVEPPPASPAPALAIVVTGGVPCPVLAAGEPCLTLTVHPGAIRAGAVLARRHPRSAQLGTVTAHLSLTALGRDAQVVPRRSPLVVAPTALSSAATALLTVLRDEDPTPAAADTIATVLVQLTRGLLGGIGSGVPAPRFQDIRNAVRARLADGNVLPATVAADLDTSPKQIRDVLATSESTFASLVRETRMNELAELIRRSGPGASLSELPSAVGITSYPQAARAFKQRYGLTMREYRGLVRMLHIPVQGRD